MRRPAAPAGFTLIEVLVALAILAITLAAGMRASGALAGNAQRLADVTAAQWCADNALTDLRLSGQFPGLGESPLSCEQLGITWMGSLQVAATPNPNFRRVVARIVDADERQVVAVSTILGRQ